MKVAISSTNAKKKYSSPKLTELGHIAQLTLGSFSTKTDAGGTKTREVK